MRDGNRKIVFHHLFELSRLNEGWPECGMETYKDCEQVLVTRQV